MIRNLTVSFYYFTEVRFAGLYYRAYTVLPPE